MEYVNNVIFEFNKLKQNYKQVLSEQDLYKKQRDLYKDQRDLYKKQRDLYKKQHEELIEKFKSYKEYTEFNDFLKRSDSNVKLITVEKQTENTTDANRKRKRSVSFADEK